MYNCLQKLKETQNMCFMHEEKKNWRLSFKALRDLCTFSGWYVWLDYQMKLVWVWKLRKGSNLSFLTSHPGLLTQWAQASEMSRIYWDPQDDKNQKASGGGVSLKILYFFFKYCQLINIWNMFSSPLSVLLVRNHSL